MQDTEAKQRSLEKVRRLLSRDYWTQHSQSFMSTGKSWQPGSSHASNSAKSTNKTRGNIGDEHAAQPYMIQHCSPGKYGLGVLRTIEQLQDSCGVDFTHCTLELRAQTGIPCLP